MVIYIVCFSFLYCDFEIFEITVTIFIINFPMKKSKKKRFYRMISVFYFFLICQINTLIQN
eukprot:UN27098